MQFPKTTEAVRVWEMRAGGLSIAAGVLHAALSPSHMEEWWGYGVFFIFTAAAQVIFGIMLLSGAPDPKAWRGDWRTAKRNLLIAGIAGNVFLVFLYMVSRTVGVPAFGPEAGEVEDVAFIDIVTKLVEVALIGMLIVLLRSVPKAAPEH